MDAREKLWKTMTFSVKKTARSPRLSNVSQEGDLQVKLIHAVTSGEHSNFAWKIKIKCFSKLLNRRVLGKTCLRKFKIPFPGLSHAGHFKLA
jgi:hypothetical protein